MLADYLIVDRCIFSGKQICQTGNIVTLPSGSSDCVYTLYPPTETEHCDTVADCTAAVRVFVGVTMFTYFLTVVGAIYAAHHRSQIRRKFGIAGSFLGDCCAWYWCGACALCQETRTLWHNNVVDGVWLGPIRSPSDRRAQTLPCYTAPTGTKMSG